MVEGAVSKPQTFGLDDLLKLSPMEERIYRLRCVEGWSMVIPWVGWSLAALIRRVEPTGNAKYVEFHTLADPKQMPGLRSGVLDWPYVEGLRMDEAMHPLTLLAFGMYGEVLPNQNGAPLRLVVPWKYGFKSGKSIVRIRFVEQQPQTAWVKAAGREYGFYSNVNPKVRPPALEPGDREAHRRGRPVREEAPDVDVQRLRGPGRPALRAGVWVAGAEAGGNTVYWKADFVRPTALVLGGEDRGVRRLVRERCDYLVSLPLLGSISSLNVSVAAGILLYEALRQRS